jgi:hypothetical protein
LPHYLTYAIHTLHVLRNHIDSVDKIYFPTYAQYDSAFAEQIEAHKPVCQKAEELSSLLTSAKEGTFPAERVSQEFGHLSTLVPVLFQRDEALINGLGRRVPVSQIELMEKQHRAGRVEEIKKHGHLWAATYLLSGMNAKEREVFPPGVPLVVKSGMIMSGSLWYRRYVIPFHRCRSSRRLSAISYTQTNVLTPLQGTSVCS